MQTRHQLSLSASVILLILSGCGKNQPVAGNSAPDKGLVGAPALLPQYLQFQTSNPVQFNVTFTVGGGYVNPCQNPSGPLSSFGGTLAECELNLTLGAQVAYEATITGASAKPLVVRSCAGCLHVAPKSATHPQ